MKFFSLNQLPIHAEDIFFTFWDDVHTKDTIVVFNPMDSIIVSPVLPRSRKSLQEHIDCIQRNNIKKAIVVGDNIDFLRQCPTLEHLKVYPSIDARNFDYSPIYDLPNLKSLEAITMYGLKATYDVDEAVRISNIDYSKFKNLRKLSVIGAEGHLNVKNVETVVSLYCLRGFPKAKTLHNTIPGPLLKKLVICESPISSLDGIEVATGLQWLDLDYNRRLTDISALRYLSDSLVYLGIDSCGKIRDFSVLSQLHNLEFLTLKGSNTLHNLSFLKNMPKLKNFRFDMNVEDGNLKLCEAIPYVRIKNHKHYSHKDKDLPKEYTDPTKYCSFDI